VGVNGKHDNKNRFALKQFIFPSAAQVEALGRELSTRFVESAKMNMFSVCSLSTGP